MKNGIENFRSWSVDYFGVGHDVSLGKEITPQRKMVTLMTACIHELYS